MFIDAICNCQKQTSKKIRAFIIGDGELAERLQTYCKNTNTEQIITFTSWIKDVDVAYAGLDIVALTSFNEGTPVSIIEAQAAGKPVVSTNVGGISDIVQEDETALLSEIDTEKFTEKLTRLINDDYLREKMSEKSRQFSDSKFSYVRLCTDMENVYKKFMK